MYYINQQFCTCIRVLNHIYTTHTESIEPLKDVRLLNASSHHLMFSWTRAPTNCSSVQYIVKTNNNCGNCPNRTNSTQVKCSLSEHMHPTHEQLLKICKFKVNIALCNNFQEWMSNWNTTIVTVKLKCKLSAI